MIFHNIGINVLEKKNYLKGSSPLFCLFLNLVVGHLKRNILMLTLYSTTGDFYFLFLITVKRRYRKYIIVII